MELTAQKLQEAIRFAAEKHDGQFRKGDGRPYVLHPLSMAITLDKIKKSKNKFLCAVVCVCHDLVEDCPDVTLVEIADRFGHIVAGLVAELTTDKKKCEELGKQNYLTQKMLSMSSYGLRFKLADRYDNICDSPSDKTIEETVNILNELKAKRKLTKTHNKLIKLIEKEIKKKKKLF